MSGPHDLRGEQRYKMLGSKNDREQKKGLNPESLGSASFGTMTKGKTLTEGNGVSYRHRPADSSSVMQSSYGISEGKLLLVVKFPQQVYFCFL